MEIEKKFKVLIAEIGPKIKAKQDEAFKALEEAAELAKKLGLSWEVDSRSSQPIPEGLAHVFAGLSENNDEYWDHIHYLGSYLDRLGVSQMTFVIAEGGWQNSSLYC